VYLFFTITLIVLIRKKNYDTIDEGEPTLFTAYCYILSQRTAFRHILASAYCVLFNNKNPIFGVSIYLKKKGKLCHKYFFKCSTFKSRVISYKCWKFEMKREQNKRASIVLLFEILCNVCCISWWKMYLLKVKFHVCERHNRI